MLAQISVTVQTRAFEDRAEVAEPGEEAGD